MKAISVVLVTLFSAWTPNVLAGEATPKTSLLAASKEDHTLAIVDPITFKVVSRLPLGPDPHEVAVTADGKTAYVSNTSAGNAHEINVIDLVAQKALPSIDTGSLTGPHGLASAGSKLWFTAQGAKAIASFDPVADKFDRIIGTGQEGTHMILVSPDEKRMYTTNNASGSISIFVYEPVQPRANAYGRPRPDAKPQLEWVHTVVPVSDGIEGFDLSPDWRELWTATPVTGEVFILDTASRAITRTDVNVAGANRLKFTPDGKYVLISSLRTGDFVVIDAAARKEIRRLDLGEGCSGVLVEPSSARAYVACTPDNFVAVVDLKTFVVVAHVDVGPRPDGLGWAIR